MSVVYDPAVIHPAYFPIGKQTIKLNEYDSAKNHPGAVVEKRKNWVPLESDPQLLTKYIHNLGVSSEYVFHEILSPELLFMVPQPVYAVLMLFPVSEASEKHRKEQEEEVAALEEKEGKSQDKDGVYFIKQVIGNACGTIGLTHCVCNLTKQLELDDDKFFAKFHAATKDMNGLARAKALEDNEDIEVEHQATAAQGAENVSDAVNDNLHFNTFVRVGDNLYELDGRKERPINHGPCKADEVLSKAVAECQKFMARDPDDIRFNMVALGHKQ